MASGSGGTHGQSSLPIHTPAKFHPSKSFAFPSRNFGSKGEKRSFRAEGARSTTGFTTTVLQTLLSATFA